MKTSAILREKAYNNFHRVQMVNIGFDYIVKSTFDNTVYEYHKCESLDAANKLFDKLTA